MTCCKAKAFCIRPHVETALTVVEVSDTISAATDFAYVWSGLNEEMAGTGLW